MGKNKDVNFTKHNKSVLFGFFFEISKDISYM